MNGPFLTAIAFWLAAWAINIWLARLKPANPTVANIINILIPVLFGAALIALWEGVTRGFNVPSVLLPAPSMIWGRILSSTTSSGRISSRPISRR
jgi:NitT/TauT family transport system permease protein